MIYKINPDVGEYFTHSDESYQSYFFLPTRHKCNHLSQQWLILIYFRCHISATITHRQTATSSVTVTVEHQYYRQQSHIYTVTLSLMLNKVHIPSLPSCSKPQTSQDSDQVLSRLPTGLRQIKSHFLLFTTCERPGRGSRQLSNETEVMEFGLKTTAGNTHWTNSVNDAHKRLQHMSLNALALSKGPAFAVAALCHWHTP